MEKPARTPFKTPLQQPTKNSNSNKIIEFSKYGASEGLLPWAQQEFMSATEAVDIDSMDLMNISVAINGKVFKANVLDELKIDKDDLNTCFVEQPGKYAWWAILSQMAQSKTDLAKAEVERLEGDLDSAIRSAILSGGEKPTEEMVKRRIKNHPDYIQANRYYLDCKKISDILDAARRAFDHRKESLISIGANQRADADNTDLKILSMKEQAKSIMSKNQ